MASLAPRLPSALRRALAEAEADRPRRLSDLVSVGPAAVSDLAVLGIHTVEQLADHEPGELYERLCEATGARHDPCVRDVFSAAVAQARDPELPEEQKQWWFWTRVRKREAEAGVEAPKRKLRTPSTRRPGR